MAQSRRTFPAELRRYADPMTEFPVLRLTDPNAADCRFPAIHNRFVSRRGGFLVYTRDNAAVCRLDVKSGVTQELVDAQGIDPLTLSITADERSAFWMENGRRLVQAGLGTGRKRTVYEVPRDWELAPGTSVSEDGLFVTLVERKADVHRIRLIGTGKGSATTPVESPNAVLANPVIRPKRAGFFYQRADSELWLANFDGSQNYRLKVPEGTIRSAHWAVDGRSIDYLVKPADAKLSSIREVQPDGNEDKQVAQTSQFAAVHRNADASVFVGASASKASPHVLLMLRTTRREFTLAEHKASDPSLVTPVFSANSQRVFFQTDRDGKWAIYSMQIEKIVEETDG